jgi:2-polyprenyl-3-methyl-5-hydroxy-6-metoxy-1,4-benzoquinol methylase
MNTNYKVIKNLEHGFKQVSPLPTVDELAKFYNSNYYDAKGYSVEYSPDEIIHKEIPAFEIEYYSGQNTGSILDIGCGEGFVLDFFHKKGWNVTGLDFSHDGVSRHFPHLKEKVIKGDVFNSLENLMESQAKFDLIVCNNVLEHVLDPISFLKKFKSLCHANTLIRIQVPNDFSWYQDVLIRKGIVTKEYWVAPPGHLNYFNKDNLKQFLKSFEYNLVDLLGDFPIELFLLNEKSNYSVNPEVGPMAHKARVIFEVDLYNSSIENYISFRRGCGMSGVCRNLIAYCKIN